jgi:hypothetical protein
MGLRAVANPLASGALPSNVTSASLNSITPEGGALSVTGGALLLGATSAFATEGYRFYKNYGRYDNGTFTGFIGAGGSLGGNATDFAIRSQADLTFMAGGGGTDMTLDTSGNLLVGTTSNGSSAKMVVYGGNGVTVSDGTFTGYIGKGSWVSGASASDFGVRSDTNLLFLSGGGTERGRFDTGGNLLVGTSSGSYHTIRKNVTADAGNAVAEIQGDAGATAVIFYGVSGYGANAANAAAKFGFDNVTSRSINAGGTINASGADAAEYERNGGLKIAKGQIVGFGPDGVLTDRFDLAIRFGVKSTDPHIVGGDTWGTEDKIGKRPEEPKFKAPEYIGRAKPEDLPEDATEEQASQHARDMADWNVDQVEHKARTDIERNLFDTATYPEYLRDKAAFEERLEAARQQVDRVAYCGKVPCNVQGATPGDYIVAVNDGSGGIKGLPVRNPTFEQYRAAVGRVNRILPDGRAEIAVIVH